MTSVVSRLLDLPAGMDVGLLAGALTESAAIGAAEAAMASGAARLSEGMTPVGLSPNGKSATGAGVYCLG